CDGRVVDHAINHHLANVGIYSSVIVSDLGDLPRELRMLWEIGFGRMDFYGMQLHAAIIVLGRTISTAMLTPLPAIRQACLASLRSALRFDISPAHREARWDRC